MHRMLPPVHGACSGAYGARVRRATLPSVPIQPSSDPPPLSLPLSRQPPPRCSLLSGALPRSRALSPPSPPPPLWQLPPQILAQLFFSMAIAEGLRAQIIFKGDRPAGAP